MMNQVQVETLLKPALAKLEGERQQIKKQVQWNNIKESLRKALLMVGLVLFSIVLGQILEGLFWLMFLNICTFLGIFYILTTGMNVFTANLQLAQNFQEKVKRDLFTQIFEQWNATATYLPDKGIEKTVFDLVGDNRYYNTYTADDYVEGQLGDGREFFFSEIYHRHITGHEGDYLNQQRGLLVILKNSGLIEELPATIRMTTNTSPPKKKRKKIKAPASKKNVENILDGDYSPPSTLEESSLLENKFHIENLNNTPVIPLLPEQWKTQLHQLQHLVRNELVLLSQDATCYLWVKHKTEFWQVSIHTPLTEPTVRRTLSWNFAHCFILVDYLSKLTVKIRG